MSAFDVTVRVGSVDIQPVQDEDGGLYDAQLSLGIVTLIPVGPGQAAPLPLGSIRSQFDKGAVGKLIEELQSIHEKLEDRPKPSGLQIAGSMHGVDQVAQTLGDLK